MSGDGEREEAGCGARGVRFDGDFEVRSRFLLRILVGISGDGEQEKAGDSVWGVGFEDEDEVRGCLPGGSNSNRGVDPDSMGFGTL